MKEEIKAKREQLKTLSKSAQQLVKTGLYDSINEALADIYATQGHTEIHSFKRWKELGFIVKKGEKALLLWGQPRQAGHQEKAAQDEKDEFKFWPLAYVFSQLQVQPITEKVS